MLLAVAMGMGAAVITVQRRSAAATARLDSATHELNALVDGPAEDDGRRSAIAWGYAERLRLGLESPFRLIDAASRDPRLRPEERRTVSWALLAHVLRGDTHAIDGAALDHLGPTVDGRSVAGEQHLELIADVVTRAEDPRAGELAVRLAYTLAAAERLVEGPAPQLAAEAAALLADREIARREAGEIVRTAGGNPIQEIQRRRARRAFYVERPVLFEPEERVEREAIGLVRPALEWLRVMSPETPASRDTLAQIESLDTDVASTLFDVGRQLPPEAPLVVTVRRYAPVARSQAPGVDPLDLARVHNAEMLAAVTHVPEGSRQQRRTIGRLLLATAVAKRSLAQQRVWFPGDSAASLLETATALAVGGISFDRDVPQSWRPFFLMQLSDGVRQLRRVLPSLRLEAVHIRFRMSAPADSALAMHDPRSRTVHLPVLTAAGTLTHELAHDLDRRSAAELGMAGYRSDNSARSAAAPRPQGSGSGRLAASLRALTDEAADQARSTRAQADRPAEIFATRVDWFVSRALARRGISSGILSAMQDEWLTGHVVHTDRLRNSNRSRSLLTALTEMTPVAPFAAEERDPSLQTLLRWSLAGPVDRRVAAGILQGRTEPLALPWLGSELSCEDDEDGRAALIRMAAESRARGWLRLRARWMSEEERAPWARAALGQGPWSAELSERRVAELTDYVLVQLTADQELSAGLPAYAAPLVARARCN